MSFLPPPPTGDERRDNSNGQSKYLASLHPELSSQKTSQEVRGALVLVVPITLSSSP